MYKYQTWSFLSHHLGSLIILHKMEGRQPKQPEGTEEVPLLSEMASDDDFEVPDDVDGVAPDSNVRRRVLGKIRLFKAAISVCDPHNVSPEAAQAREVQWLAQVDKRFEDLIAAISDIENEDGLSVRDSEDAEKLAVFMTTTYSEYTARLSEKCQSARAQVPPAQAHAGAGAGGWLELELYLELEL